MTTLFSYTVHPNGLLATVTVDGPLSNDTVIYTYDSSGDLTQVANAIGHATQYGVYNALGQPGRITGPNGDITDFVYDARGRVTDIKPIIGGIAQTTHYTYDGFGRVASVQTPDGRTHVREYDAAWRMVREYEQEPAGTYAVKRYTYNNASLVTSAITERTTAVVPPTGQPTITVPAEGLNGSYRISWTAVSAAEEYVLDESLDGLNWVTVYTGVPLYLDFTGKAAGTYYYRVKACNAAGCAAVSLHYPVQVIYPPSTASAPSVSSPNTTGSYTVTWPSVAGANRYQLDESANGGASWTTIHDAAGTSKPVSGKGAGTYNYRVKACNNAGCGGASTNATVQVVTPAAAPSPSAPAQSTAGSYTVSWNAITYASMYQLEESANGGVWTLIHNAGATSKAVSGKTAGTYSYRVKACNAVGCGPTSGTVSVIEIDPPAGTPVPSAPGVNASGSYIVSWTSVGGATSYQLEESVEGGGWTLIQNDGSTSRWMSGKSTSTNYSYQVRACNAAGCGPTSGSILVSKIIYGAQYIGQSVPASIESAEVVAVWVQMQNTGNTTWTAGEAFNLGSQNAQDNTRWGLSRVAVPGSVAPGQVATFYFNITGPTPSAEGGPGMRAFQWRMVRDGVTWFGDLTPNTGIWLDAACTGPRCDQLIAPAPTEGEE